MRVSEVRFLSKPPCPFRLMEYRVATDHEMGVRVLQAPHQGRTPIGRGSTFRPCIVRVRISPPLPIVAYPNGQRDRVESAFSPGSNPGATTSHAARPDGRNRSVQCSVFSCQENGKRLITQHFAWVSARKSQTKLGQSDRLTSCVSGSSNSLTGYQKASVVQWQGLRLLHPP